MYIIALRRRKKEMKEKEERKERGKREREGWRKRREEHDNLSVV